MLLLAALQVLVDQTLFLPTVERDEGPAASGPVNGLGFREYGELAVKIAKVHGTALRCHVSGSAPMRLYYSHLSGKSNGLTPGT